MKWDEYMEEVRVYSTLPLFQKKVEQSKKVIAEFLNIVEKPYVAWSGGKDSTALVLMVREFGNIPAMSEKDDLDYPGEEEYIKEIAERFDIDLHIIKPEVSLFEWMLENEESVVEEIHARSAELSKKYFYALIDRFVEEGGYDSTFLGLRAYESTGRLMNFKTRGFYYQKKNGIWICNPLSLWKTIDVYAYLYIKGVEPLYVYKYDPENTRKSWFLPGENARNGAAFVLKERFPELYYKLVKKFPEVGRYV